MEPQCICPCVYGRDGPCQYMSSCYVPVCPPGTYMCCVTCIFSSCKRNGFLLKSSRGAHECIICPPGHFCDGCDLPRRCPDGTITDMLGNVKESDCEACDVGLVASSDQTRCCSEGGNCQISSTAAYNYLVNYALVPSRASVGKPYTHFGLSILVIKILFVYIYSRRLITVIISRLSSLYIAN